MAFDSRVKGDGTLQCAVCRCIITDGRRIRIPDYLGDAPICKDCSERFYKNRTEKLDIALYENAVEAATLHRTAEILENDRMFRIREPEIGYEYPVIDTTIAETLRDTLLWLLLCVILMGLLVLFGSKSYPDGLDVSASAFLLRMGAAGGSVLFAARTLLTLVHGMVRGMSHTRRLVLLLRILVLAAAAAGAAFLF